MNMYEEGKEIIQLVDYSAPTPKVKDRSVRAQKIKNPEDRPPFFIRGVQADSKEEYWVSLALEKIEEAMGWTWSTRCRCMAGDHWPAGM